MKPFKPTVYPYTVTHPPTSHYTTRQTTTTLEHMNSTASLSIKSQTLKTTATQTAASNKKTEQSDDKTQMKLVLQKTTPAPSAVIIPKHHLTSKPNSNTTQSIPDDHSTNLASINIDPSYNLLDTTIATHGKNDTVNKCLLCPSIFPPLGLYTYIWPPYKVCRYLF